MEESGKVTKRKPKYGLFHCVGFIYQYLWKNERWLAVHGLLTVIVTVAAAALTLYTPSLILEALESASEFGYVALVIVGLLLAGGMAGMASAIVSFRNDVGEMYMTSHLMYLKLTEQRTRDWYHRYSEAVQRLDERADKAVRNNHATGVHLPMDFAAIVATILNFLLFGGVVSMLHPLIVVFLAVGCAISYAMTAWERKANYRQMDERNAADKRRGYVNHMADTYRYGKDIRLYRMQGFLHTLSGKIINDCQHYVDLWERRSFLTAVVSFLIILVRDGLAYGFLISKAVSGEVDAAQFVLYFSAITALSGYMNDILANWARVAEGAMQISDFLEDQEIPDKLSRGKGIPTPKGLFSIEFKDVCYRYPMGEKQVLNHVSFRIKAGEKIALVGLNGAGKTTLTMLMCGLLLPDSGEVLIDGHSILDYNRDELYDLFGLVPQNYSLLPMSIGRNIACTKTEEEIDRQKLWACLEMVGLAEKIRSLPLQERTPLNRRVYPEAVDLSGGEKQKLLMARLLYKNPPCMILDEPTAALDPIAESKMYERYNEITANATSVFISHRLASTRFCDRIFLLDGANFAEEGTHEELMAAGKKYRELFDIQSRYYKEGEMGDGQ